MISFPPQERRCPSDELSFEGLGFSNRPIANSGSLLQQEVSKEMDNRGFYKPDLDQLAEKARAIFKNASLKSSMLAKPTVTPRTQKEIVILNEIGGSNGRHLAFVVDGHKPVEHSEVIASTASLRDTKKTAARRLTRRDASSVSSFEDMIETGVLMGLVKARPLIQQKKNRSLPINFILLVSDAIQFGEQKAFYKDAFVELPDSWAKPNFDKLKIPEKLNISEFVHKVIKARLPKKNVSVIVEHDSNATVEISAASGVRADGALVLCTGLGGSNRDPKTAVIRNAEPGFLVKLEGDLTEQIFSRSSASATKLLRRSISTAEEISSGDKLVELFNYWCKELSTSCCPDLAAIINRETRSGKRRAISRKETELILITGGKINENLSALQKRFDPDSKFAITEKAFCSLFVIAHKLLIRSNGVLAAVAAGLAGSFEGRDQVHINLDTTVQAHPKMLALVEETAKRIARSNAYPEPTISFIAPKTLGLHTKVLSVPIQGILSYQGIELVKKVD